MKQMIWVSECRFYFFSSFCMKHVHLTIWLLFEFHSFCNFAKNLQNSMQVRDRLQIPLLKLSRFKRINQLLFPLKWSENLLFSDGFRGIELSSSIRSILLNIRSEIWRLSLKTWLMSWFFLNLRVCYSCKLRTSTFTLLLIQPLYIFKAS